MIKCPYCKEEIQAEARKCKHCGEWLTNRDDKDSKWLREVDDNPAGYVPVRGGKREDTSSSADDIRHIKKMMNWGIDRNRLLVYILGWFIVAGGIITIGEGVLRSLGFWGKYGGKSMPQIIIGIFFIIFSLVLMFGGAAKIIKWYTRRE